MTEPVAATESSRLPTLTSLRWYAALFVFACHASGWSQLRFLKPFASGYFGVTFFFVLSGFVLTWSARAGLPRTRFWWNRFARIYPSHLVMFLVVLALSAAAPSLVDGKGIGPALAEVALVNAWWPHGGMIGYNGVSWSLSAEAFFYLCFPFIVAVFARRRRLATVATVGALAAGLAFACYGARHGWDVAATAYFNPLARLPEFVLGIWLAQRVRSRSLPSVNLWLAVGACIVSFVVVWRFALPWYPASDYVMLPSLAAVVVAGAQYDSSGRVGWLAAVLRHRWSLYLGEVSFAFYLLHATVLAVIKPPASTGTVARCGFLLLALAVAALAAAALNRVVERPARVALLDLAARRRCRAAVVTAPVSPGGSPR